MGRGRAAWVGSVGLVVLLAGIPIAEQNAVALPRPSAAVADDGTDGSGVANPGLDVEDRDRVAEAEAAGDSTVTLLVAADDGKVDEAAAQMEALGGVVETTEESIDYLKVVVPIGNAEKAALVPAAMAVDVDGLIELDDPRPNGSQPATPQTPPSASTPAVNPYLPTGDTGAAQFVAAHPTYDGRGTIVAIMDTGVDLDTPSLSTTSTGLPKIIDWYNANAVNSGDGTWVTTTGRITGTFTTSGHDWTAPAVGGPFAFGILKENAQDLAAGELGGDLDRDGTAGESFGVLQDRTTKAVYVDLDGDFDFTDQVAMLDFGVAGQVGFFGTDNPATPVEERVPFAVTTDRSVYDPASDAGSFVNIGVAGAAHGTHVAGISTGNALFGGTMNGVAPGAQVMSIKVCLTTTSCTSSGLIDGAVYAANHGADVINISIGGLPALNDGNNARATLYNNLIKEKNVQIIISAGNDGTGANSVGDPSVASDSLSVGSSITKATWQSNYGSDLGVGMSLHPFSSRGPTEAGGFKPDIVAPGSAISTIPGWQPGGPTAGTYTLPPGYAMFNGTSMAAPQATGAAALLIGAYKAAHGARPPAAALRDAIKYSATFLPGLGAYEQGRGLVAVQAAWDRLEAGFTPDGITATVPVNSVLSGLLAVPGVGTGIYEREGLTAGGSTIVRTYTLTRSAGPAGDLTLPVEWIGNDGTFISATTVTLPLGVATSFPVTIDPATAGIHSAILQIDDPATNGMDLATMNAAIVPTTAVGGAVTLTGTVPRNQTRHIFVAVPSGVGALIARLDGGGPATGAGQVRFQRFTPQGLPIDPAGSLTCYNPDAGGGCSTGSSTLRSTVNPMAGVWEFIVEARRTSDIDLAPFTLTIAMAAAEISPNPDLVLDPAAAASIPRTYDVVNKFATFTGRLVGSSLASTKRARPTIAHLASQTFDVTLPAGVSSYTVTTGNSSDVAADIDLLLYRCASPASCTLIAASGGSTAVEKVSVNNPTASLYRIEVQGFDVPSGTTAYDLADSWVSTALGSITTPDVDASRAAGSTWSVPASIDVTGVSPGAGRFLTGNVTIVNDAGLTLGQAAVELLADAIPTTTALSADIDPSDFGQAVVLTATVASGVGTPTGTVQFSDGVSTLGSAPLIDGVATLPISSLAVGTHSLAAQYAAHDAYGESASSTVDHTVNHVATTTTLISAPNPSVLGNAVTLTATVTGLGGTPTGAIEFFDGATSVATVPMLAGVATLTTSSLAVGPHSLVAAYSGDDHYAPSTSTANDQSVDKTASTTLLTAAPSPSTFGSAVAMTATVISPAGTPSGTVEFFDGPTSLGSAALTGGHADLSVSSLAAGSHSLHATYSGDAMSLASTSAPLVHGVDHAGSATTLTSDHPTAVLGDTVTITINVAAAGAISTVPTGQVVVSIAGVPQAPIALDSSGAASFSTALLPLGTTEISAAYQGDASFDPSTSPALQQKIVAFASTTELTAGAPSSAYGSTATFSVAVHSSGPGVPSGDVELFDGSTSLGTQSLAAGAATFSITALSAGDHSLTARYAGNSSHTPSTSGAVSHHVDKASSKVSVTAKVTDGIASIDVRVSSMTEGRSQSRVRAAGVPILPDGVVSVFEGSDLLGSSPLTNGAAQVTVPALAPGAHTLNVVYSGDANYAGASSTVTATVESVAVLPETGSTIEPFVQLAMVLLIVGIAISPRRRRRTQPAAPRG